MASVYFSFQCNAVFKWFDLNKYWTFHQYDYVNHLPHAVFSASSKSLIKSSLFSRPMERRILK